MGLGRIFMLSALGGIRSSLGRGHGALPAPLLFYFRLILQVLGYQAGSATIDAVLPYHHSIPLVYPCRRCFPVTVIYILGQKLLRLTLLFSAALCEGFTQQCAL